MDDARFTIRYRLPGTIPVLLVEEEAGDLFTIDRRGLHTYHTGAGDGRATADRLSRQGWLPVPAVAPYTLDELLRLLPPFAN